MIELNNPKLKIKSLKIKDKAPEGYVNDNRKFEITLQDDTCIQLLIKLKTNKVGDSDCYWQNLKRWREAGVYRDIHPSLITSDAIHAPHSYLSIANPKTTQFLVVLEFVAGAKNVKTFLSENCETRKKFKEGEITQEEID